MRIAVDARILSAPRAGSANYLLNLLRALPAAAPGHEYLLVTGHEQIVNLIGVPGRWTVLADPAARLGDARWEQVKLVELLERHQPDVFFSPTLTLPLLRVCPQAVVVFDLGFERFPEFYEPSLRAYLKRWVSASVAAADAVITLSEFGRRELCELYACDPGKVAVIPGAAEERFRPVPPGGALAPVLQRHGLRQPFVLCVAGIEKNKNLERLVRAFAEAIRDDLREWSLVLAGRPGGATHSLLAAVESQGLGNRVRLLGPVSDEELPALYNAAGVFAFPSLYEGFGLPPLEAMACGTAVLVSNAASLPEVVGDAAVIVEAESTPDIAEGLRRLMSDSALRSRLSTLGREQAQRFSWRRSAELLLGVFDRISLKEEVPVA
jgi:glycosyltransferase involved in cell wall biosynthesis